MCNLIPHLHHKHRFFFRTYRMAVWPSWEWCSPGRGLGRTRSQPQSWSSSSLLLSDCQPAIMRRLVWYLRLGRVLLDCNVGGFGLNACSNFWRQTAVVAMEYLKNEHTYILHFRIFFYEQYYRSGTVNSKSFVGKVLLQIKRKFQLNYAL